MKFTRELLFLLFIVSPVFGQLPMQPSIRVTIHGMDWSKAQQRMRSGEFDVIAPIFRTEARTVYWAFSKSYSRINVPIFFQKDISDIVDIRSLKRFVVAVKEGDAAVALLKKNGIDTLPLFNTGQTRLLLIEDHFASRTGLEAVRKLRQMPEFYAIPIIAVTARAFMEECREMLQAGCNCFLAKPYLPEELFEALKRYLPVRIIHENQQGAGGSAFPTVNAEAFSEVPRKLWTELVDALERSDIQRINQLVQNISELNPKAGETLTWHTEKFAYSTILKILNGILD